MSDSDMGHPSGGGVPPAPAPAAVAAPAGGVSALRPEPADVVGPVADSRFDWRRAWAAVLRFKWAVTLVTVLGTGAGIAAARLMVPPQYVAQATIWIEVPRRGEADRGPIRTAELLQAQAWVDLLRSYVVLDHVVQELRLYLDHPAADSALFSGFRLGEQFVPGAYRLEVYRAGNAVALWSGNDRLEEVAVGDSVGRVVGFLWRPRGDRLWPGRSVEFRVLTPRDAAIRLGEQLRTRMDPNGNFLRLEFRAASAAHAARVLNAVADRYVEIAADLKGAKLRELTGILDEQLRYAEQQLRDAEAALEDFRVRTITLPSDRAIPVTPGLEVTRDPAFASFFDMKIQEDQLRRDRQAIESALAAARDSALSVGALEVIPAVQASSELRQALADLAAKRAERRALAQRYTEEHPLVRNVAAEIETLERVTVPRLARQVVDDLRSRERQIRQLTRSAATDLEEVPPRAIEEARLARRVAIAENLYTTLQTRYEEARLAAASSIPDVRILDRAIPPHRPVNTKDGPRLAVLAFLGSLGAGVLGAVWLDRTDRRLRYPDEVTRHLGLPVLGAVPHVKTGNGKVSDDAATLEAFRSVRLSLSHAYGAAGPLVVTVTSPGPGDGKTFVAANLAAAFADVGHRTLLVDGDVRRGALHTLLGAGRKPGLTDFLAGLCSRDRLVQRTRIPKLSLVASGSRMQAAPDLLQSPAMMHLLAELRSQYSVVLVDSPPLAAGADPFYLATLTGHLLLVVRTGATDRNLTEAKLDLLDRLPVRILGAVLNDVPAKGVYRYYRYVSGYEAEDELPPAVPRART